MDDKYQPSTVFNDGDVDIEVVFPSCQSKKEAENIATYYTHAVLNIDNRTVHVEGREGEVKPVSLDAIICKVCTKALPPPIDCRTEEGRKKARETVLKQDLAYVVTEEDMKRISLDEMIEYVHARANGRGEVVYESIAYGISHMGSGECA